MELQGNVLQSLSLAESLGLVDILASGLGFVDFIQCLDTIEGLQCSLWFDMSEDRVGRSLTSSSSSCSIISPVGAAIPCSLSEYWLTRACSLSDVSKWGRG